MERPLMARSGHSSQRLLGRDRISACQSGVLEIVGCLQIPNSPNSKAKSPIVSGGHVKYSRLRRWTLGLICSGWPVRQLRTPTSLIGFFMHATFDYAGCRHAGPNAGASCRIADAPLAMSPAPRAVRDVELAALEHVRPIEPGKQLRLQQPHAAAGNARVEREARRHPAAIGELGEHDLVVGNGGR